VRVLLDSNVWLAILTTDGACRQGWRLARASCQFFTAEAILFEIEDKLRLKFGFAPRHAVADNFRAPAILPRHRGHRPGRGVP